MGLIQNLMYGVAKRWIAGKDMQTALERAKEANAKGMGVILNFLGEGVTEPSAADAQADEYARLQQAMHSAGVDGCVSVKLTQFGLGSPAADSVLQRAEALADAAAKLNQTLWIDMEGSGVTTKTLEIYSQLLRGHRNVGVALQSYLRRSEDDLRGLLDMGARVRLVKGAYREPPDVAFTSRAEVSSSYLRLMRVLFERGDGFAVGTHDSALIEEARALSRSTGTRFEFEFLRGIRDDLKPTLVREGYRVVEYVPYGEDWYGYSMRRIREHPSNIWLLIRSI